MAFAQIAERQESARRRALVTDITTVAAGLYAKKGENPIGDHLDSLDKIYYEDNKNGKPKRLRRIRKRA